MKKKQLINVKSINKVLSLCRFNPKTDASIKLLIDLDDEYYYLVRAVELLQEARRLYINKMYLTSTANILKTIKVLILFLLSINKENNTQENNNEPTRSPDTEKADCQAQGS